MPASDVIVRLRLAGQAAFNAGAQQAASSVEHIGTSAKTASKGTSGFGKTLGGLKRGLAPLGALAGAAGFAGVGVALGGAVSQGIKFNANMEQSRVAFTNLLGNSGDAQAMLDRLYKTAAATPFEFPQLVSSTQKLLGFGMAAKDVEPTMKAVGDAVAAAGGGSEQIDRVATALGQIQAKGKVSSEELLQLSESGVPALKILGDQLGLTGAQLSKKLQAGAIDAKTGIDALTRGIEKRYGGMAAAQSKTFSGMLSTLKDNATQTLGALTGPLFNALSSKVLPKVNEIAGAIQKWAQGGGVTVAINALKAGFAGKGKSETAGYAGALGVLTSVGRVLGQVFRSVKVYIAQLWSALKPLAPFIQNILWPLLKGFAMGALGGLVVALKLVIPVVRILATALGWIGQKAAPLSPWIQKLGFVIGFLVSPLTKTIGVSSRLVQVLVRIFSVSGRIIAVLGRLAPMLGSAIAGAFRKAVSAASGALSAFTKFGRKIIDALVNGIKSAPGALLDAIKSLLPGGKIGQKMASALGFHAHGGIVRTPLQVVGERGPELAALPYGTRITPMPRYATRSTPALGGVQTTAHFYLDRRLVGTAVARDTADRRARR